MYRKALEILGILLLLAGLSLGSLGVYKICTNLPMSEEKALQEARSATSEEEGIAGSPGNDSLRNNVELQVWRSALEMRNARREEKRGEGAVLLVSGIISLIWGLTVLYNSRSTPKES